MGSIGKRLGQNFRIRGIFVTVEMIILPALLGTRIDLNIGGPYYNWMCSPRRILFTVEVFSILILIIW